LTIDPVADQVPVAGLYEPIAHLGLGLGRAEQRRAHRDGRSRIADLERLGGPERHAQAGQRAGGRSLSRDGGERVAVAMEASRGARRQHGGGGEPHRRRSKLGLSPTDDKRAARVVDDALGRGGLDDESERAPGCGVLFALELAEAGWEQREQNGSRRQPTAMGSGVGHGES
jgi:hypothetical protein